MSQLAVEGFRAERDAILTVAKGGPLTAEEWAQPSACAGWSVRDVMGHMACTLHGVVDPAFLPDTTKGTERGMEPSVAERRTWPIEAVIEEYETYSGQAADVFASLQAAPLGDTLIPMADLGTHPMSILPSTFLFDGYTHLRNDILGPNGGVDRPEPPRDEQRLRPTIEWMLAGLRGCARTSSATSSTGLSPSRSTDRAGARGPSRRAVPTVASPWTSSRPPMPSRRCTAPTTTSSSGARAARPWRDHVKIDGDADYAARVLDAVNII